MNLSRLRENVDSVRVRIREAAQRAGRNPNEITLVTVTKRSSVEVVKAVTKLGLNDLGENYPQDLWKKVEVVADPTVRWHLIGHLQGNKAKRTLPLVRMIHAVDSLKLLQTLDRLAVELAERPPVCLQVNCSAEVTKHGWSPAGILLDAEAIVGCKRIAIVGLMTMAALEGDADAARPAFIELRETRDRLRSKTDLALPELSMGMTHDFEVAIAEGATLVRIGTALFEGVDG
jgi:pyridoxal phosphate enzyme (YggS family)